MIFDRVSEITKEKIDEKTIFELVEKPVNKKTELFAPAVGFEGSSRKPAGFFVPLSERNEKKSCGG